MYESVCVLCENLHKIHKSEAHKGTYIGQTYRTLYERCGEHVAAFKRLDVSSFMLKHWALTHAELDSLPEFKFRVVKCHSDPLSRMLHEAVRILSHASMNIKSEHEGYGIARLTVEPTQWEAKQDLQKAELLDKEQDKVTMRLRGKFLDSDLFSNNRSSCRKQKTMPENKLPSSTQARSNKNPNAVEAMPTVKRPRRDTSDLVKSKHGIWNPSTEKHKATRYKSATTASIVSWLRADARKASTSKKVTSRKANVSDVIAVEDRVVESPIPQVKRAYSKSESKEVIENSDFGSILSSSSFLKIVKSYNTAEDFTNSSSNGFSSTTSSYLLNVNSFRDTDVAHKGIGRTFWVKIDCMAEWMVDERKRGYGYVVDSSSVY